GHITEQAAKLTGLPLGTPVAGGAGDNAAAAVGTGVYCQGRAFTTIGTSGVVFAPTDQPILDPEGRMHTCCAAVPGTWHMMGVMQAAGLSLNWFRRTVMPNTSYPEIDQACAQIPVGADRLLFVPHLMGTRVPSMDADARGVFFGLSAHHTAKHMARAVMEGISYSLYECLDLLDQIGISIDEMVLCGGGAKSPFWQQMLCDIYGVPVKTMASSEGAALGAAILGGCAAGVYSSVAEGCERTVHAKDVLTPNDQKHEAYRQYYHVFSKLYPELKNFFSELQNC
ncbi:MAG: xylulokinase, partial [Clostridia bacterium]|nr:xylulokinase [Clostridia bacterium]